MKQKKEERGTKNEQKTNQTRGGATRDGVIEKRTKNKRQEVRKEEKRRIYAHQEETRGDFNQYERGDRKFES
jgi:hypothetical protein